MSASLRKISFREYVKKLFGFLGYYVLIYWFLRFGSFEGMFFQSLFLSPIEAVPVTTTKITDLDQLATFILSGVFVVIGTLVQILRDYQERVEAA